MNNKNKVTLEDIADIFSGQILTRVVDFSECSENVPMEITPKSISDGLINDEEFEKIFLSKKVKKEKYTKTGDVLLKLCTPFDAVYVDKNHSGLLVPSFLAIIRLKDQKSINPKYISAVLNTKILIESLKLCGNQNKRSMIKINAVKKMEIPILCKKDMDDLGEAHILSGIKCQKLKVAIMQEKEIMENIIINNIEEE